jgi:glutathione S-transferase
LIPDDEEMSKGMNAKIDEFRRKLLKPLKQLFASRGNDPDLIRTFKTNELPKHELMAPVSTHFLWGDDITIVDIMIGPFWEYLFLFKEGPMELIFAELDIPRTAPRLYTYIQKFRNHPAIERTKMN